MEGEDMYSLLTNKEKYQIVKEAVTGDKIDATLACLQTYRDKLTSILHNTLENNQDAFVREVNDSTKFLSHLDRFYEPHQLLQKCANRISSEILGPYNDIVLKVELYRRIILLKKVAEPALEILLCCRRLQSTLQFETLDLVRAAQITHAARKLYDKPIELSPHREVYLKQMDFLRDEPKYLQSSLEAIVREANLKLVSGLAHSNKLDLYCACGIFKNVGLLQPQMCDLAFTLIRQCLPTFKALKMGSSPILMTKLREEIKLFFNSSIACLSSLACLDAVLSEVIGVGELEVKNENEKYKYLFFGRKFSVTKHFWLNCITAFASKFEDLVEDNLSLKKLLRIDCRPVFDDIYAYAQFLMQAQNLTIDADMLNVLEKITEPTANRYLEGALDEISDVNSQLLAGENGELIKKSVISDFVYIIGSYLDGAHFSLYAPVVDIVAHQLDEIIQKIKNLNTKAGSSIGLRPDLPIRIPSPTEEHFENAKMFDLICTILADMPARFRGLGLEDAGLRCRVKILKGLKRELCGEWSREIMDIFEKNFISALFHPSSPLSFSLLKQGIEEFESKYISLIGSTSSPSLLDFISSRLLRSFVSQASTANLSDLNLKKKIIQDIIPLEVLSCSLSSLQTIQEDLGALKKFRTFLMAESNSLASADLVTYTPPHIFAVALMYRQFPNQFVKFTEMDSLGLGVLLREGWGETAMDTNLKVRGAAEIRAQLKMFCAEIMEAATTEHCVDKMPNSSQKSHITHNLSTSNRDVKNRQHIIRTNILLMTYLFHTQMQNLSPRRTITPSQIVTRLVDPPKQQENI